MARQMRLHLVSKLRYDSALYLPYQGPNRQRKYGEKINPRQMPEQFLCECYSDKDIQTEIYQAQVFHKEFACPLNVVIILKTNLKTQAQAHVILFTSDLELSYQKLIDYYSLRFQIEFNFRDALAVLGIRRFHEYHRNSSHQCRESVLFYGQPLPSPVARLSPRQLRVQPS